MKVKLTKISRPEGLDGGLRTPDVVGNCTSLPAIGSCFEMTAAPLESGSARFVNTSEVMELSKDGNIYTLKTRSGSVYTVEVLDINSSEPVEGGPSILLSVSLGD